MAKKLLTQAEAKAMAQELIDATQPLHDLNKALSNMKADDFDEDAMKIARTFCAVSRIASEAAQSVLTHIELSNGHRLLERLKAEAEEAKVGAAE